MKTCKVTIWFDEEESPRGLTGPVLERAINIALKHAGFNASNIEAETIEGASYVAN